MSTKFMKTTIIGNMQVTINTLLEQLAVMEALDQLEDGKYDLHDQIVTLAKDTSSIERCLLRAAAIVPAPLPAK